MGASQGGDGVAASGTCCSGVGARGSQGVHGEGMPTCVLPRAWRGVSVPHHSRRVACIPPTSPTLLTPGTSPGQGRGDSRLPAWGSMDGNPPRAKAGVTGAPPGLPPAQAPLTCQGAEGEEEAVAVHGNAVGRRGWGSAQPPAPRSSGPGAWWDRTAVPCHCQLFPTATGAGGGRGDHPRHPPASGVMLFCWKTSLAFCAGSGGLEV